MIFALAGNQNCGKTTLFNALTGSNQHVGNFPGVTVEQKSGTLKENKNHTIVDLPGIYSLRPYTQEETVSRDFLLETKPDGILNIVDATNLERSLYLTLQLLELRIPMVLALNMMDEVRAGAGKIHVRLLSERLGIPVVPISAARGEGVSELAGAMITAAQKKMRPKEQDLCPGSAVSRCILDISRLIESRAKNSGVPCRFCALKLMEDDPFFFDKLRLASAEKERVEQCIAEMERKTGFDRNEAVADMRYTFLENVVSASVVKPQERKEHTISVKLDRILTGKYTALPVFFLLLFAVFFLTFHGIGSYFSSLLFQGMEWISDLADRALTVCHVNPIVHSLVIDGIMAGVGSVLSFLPIIVTLFFFLSVLEDTGYMARVAFVMDKPLRRIGLSGKSFVPMLLGFGCSVPAILAARTLSSERDRRMTILLTPYMSCSAKIPIYAVFTAAFFEKYQAFVMMGLYASGILISLFIALILKKTVFRGSSVPFVLELPHYRLPSPKSVALLLWQKAKDFMQRAFTIIFLASILIWFLQTFDRKLHVVSGGADSILAEIGQGLSPVFQPLGFGDWRVVTSLLAGFTAKEAVVSTLAVLLNTSIADLRFALASVFSPLSAVSFLLFTLLYTPCVAAVAAIKRELGSGLAAFGVAVLQGILAWIVAFGVYQGGLRLLSGLTC